MVLHTATFIILWALTCFSTSAVDVKCPRKGNPYSSSHWTNTCNFVFHDPDHNVESREQSSLAVSTSYPNILYTMNDSPGGQRITKEDLVIFRFDLTDCTGVCDHRVVALVFPRDFSVRMDLEAIDYGECRDGGGEMCIFLGNTGGNNYGSRHDHYIWKVKEPTPTQIKTEARLDSASRTVIYNIPTEDIWSMKYAYPDQDYDWYGHIDVEAMIVDPVVRQIVLIQRNNDGSPARIWTLPMDDGFRHGPASQDESPWMTAYHEIGNGGHQVKVKQPLVTDAARSANGEVVVVRGYGSASYFYLAGRSVLQTFRDAMDHVDGWYECQDALDVKGGHNGGEGQPQGEGIALDYSGQFYYTNTEWGHWKRGHPEDNEKCITTYEVLW